VECYISYGTDYYSPNKHVLLRSSQIVRSNHHDVNADPLEKLLNTKHLKRDNNQTIIYYNGLYSAARKRLERK
jgi:hypothetical protein